MGTGCLAVTFYLKLCIIWRNIRCRWGRPDSSSKKEASNGFHAKGSNSSRKAPIPVVSPDQIWPTWHLLSVFQTLPSCHPCSWATTYCMILWRRIGLRFFEQGSVEEKKRSALLSQGNRLWCIMISHTTESKCTFNNSFGVIVTPESEKVGGPTVITVLTDPILTVFI